MRINIFYQISENSPSLRNSPEDIDRELILKIFPNIKNFQNGGSINLGDISDKLLRATAVGRSVDTSEVGLKMQKISTLLLGMPQEISLSDDEKKRLKSIFESITIHSQTRDALGLIEFVLQIAKIDTSKIVVTESQNSTTRVNLSEYIVELRSRMSQGEIQKAVKPKK